MSKNNLRKIGDMYYYDITIDNVRYRGTTKTTDKKLAENITDTIKSDIIRKKHDLPSQIEYLFKDLWNDYINFQTTGKNKDLKICLAKHFLPVFKDKIIKKITISDIKNYQMQRKFEILSLPKNKNKRESEISFRIVNMEISILHQIFEYCLERNYLQANPITKIKKLNELSRIKTLSDTDINKLINGATNKLTRDLITFLIYTGCRKGEALNLKWDDADLQNNVIAIKGTKTKYDRHIPISKPLKELLSGVERIISRLRLKIY
ncbi:MAG: tyrosine-type recombinase/integrase [bacterium]